MHYKASFSLVSMCEPRVTSWSLHTCPAGLDLSMKLCSTGFIRTLVHLTCPWCFRQVLPGPAFLSSSGSQSSFFLVPPAQHHFTENCMKLDFHCPLVYWFIHSTNSESHQRYFVGVSDDAHGRCGDGPVSMKATSRVEEIGMNKQLNI